jgi:amino acid adenylation domain-containing protein/non-ribosomal peptide synthase protein (TIGR01720 family)
MSDLAKRIADLSPEKRALLLQRLGEKSTSVFKEAIPPRADRSSFPMSFAQQRMWFLHQLDPDSSAYNIAATVRLMGKLNVMALEQSLNEIIRRHEILRATFVTVKGEPVQIVATELKLHLPVVDLQGLPETEREETALRLATQEAQHRFDLTCGPLIQLRLLRLGAEDHILLLTMHHIISDGWSIGVLIREVASLYTAFSTGKPSPLAEPPIQYSDYAGWQREWLQGERLETQLAYWKRQLGGGLPVLELPADRPRPATQSYRGAHYSFAIASTLYEQLKALSRSQGATLFMTLLAAFQTLLYRYTNQTEISIGTPIANRNRTEIETLIGLFVNTLVIRTPLEGDLTFRELLRRVREVVLEAYAHQDLPFEMLVDELQLERDLSRTPLFQVMFDLQQAPLQRLNLPGLSLSLLEVENGTAKFDLMLMIQEETNELKATLEYNTDLFDTATIARMAGHLQVLLEGIVADPDERLSKLPLLSAAERQLLICTWNATQTDYPYNQCLHHCIEAQVERTPNAPALIFEGEQLTYRELNQRANKVAHHLQKLGVGPETPVGICAERSLEMVISLLGILKAGGAYVPLDPTYPPERLAFMLDDAAVPVLLTQSHLLRTLPATTAQLFCLDTDWHKIIEESNENPASGVSADNLAYIIYTSGSTGQPKGVMIPHRGICNRLMWMQDAYRLTAEDRVLQKTPFSFDVSVWEFFWPLMAGACLVVAPPESHKDSSQLIDLINAEGITTIHFVPPMLRVLLENERAPSCRSLRRVICSGEALTLDLEQRFFTRMKAELHNLYGPTEASVDVSFWACKPATERETVPIGRPIANTQLYILDSQLQAVPIGVPGELYIGGIGLARGYLQRPDLTAQQFIPDPFSQQPGARLYRTGDLARFLPDGNIEFLGRIDNQVKLRGFRIELGEIEAVLSQHPSLREAVVLACESAEGNKRLVAYVIPEAGHAPSGSELRGFLKEKLPAYMVPSVFVTLDEWPLLPNGKIDRRALPAPGQTRPESSAQAGDRPSGRVAPRTPLEQLLARLWQAVLRIEKIGIYDNFFELGGDSIQAAVFINRLQEELGAVVPVKSIFLAPQIASLANYLNKHYPQAVVKIGPQTHHSLLIHPAPRDAELPLSFAQQRLWVLDQLEPGSPKYNLPAAVRLTGHLEVAALKQSLNEIVHRHEILRTSFATVDGRAVQIIAPELAIELPEIDLSNLPPSKREAEAKNLASEEAQRPFNLNSGPLVRACLIRLSEQDHIVVLVMHHIISDGWSAGVFIEEMAALYRAHSSGQPSPLRELPIQYADYAHWQREWLQGERLENQLAYWKQQLSGSPPVLELPTDRPRPAVQTSHGATLSFALERELSEELKALSRREGVTLFMTLLAAFQTLLYRYSGQKEICVGTPIAGRNCAELEELIGLFVNTLVLRADFTGADHQLARYYEAPSFLELVRQVQKTAIEAYDHQDLPFEILVDELQPERNLSHSPLFQVAFALNNAPIKPLVLPGLSITPLEVDTRSAKFDLTLLIQERDSELIGMLEYNTDLFDQSTIARMASHFHNLLRSITVEAAQSVATLPLLSEAERYQLLTEWNQTTTDYPRSCCIHHLFEAQVEERPDAIAISFADQDLSYRELNQRANKLAHYLQRQGAGPETLVGVCMERSVELIVALLAILKAGGAYVSLDPTYPRARLAWMLADTQTPLLLTEQRFLTQLPAHTAETICLDTDWPMIAGESADNPTSEVTAEHLAYVSYTSGSTGQPKGVSITHRGVVRLVKQTNYARLEADEVFLQFAPISFDASTFELWGCLAGGARLVVMRPETPSLAELGAALVNHQVTTLWLTAALFHQMVESQLESLRGVRQLLAGGDVLAPAQVQKYLAAMGEGCLINGYGPTENTTFTCCYEMGAACHVSNSVPIGRPISNTQVYVLDEQLNPVPIGVVGELYIGGDGLARGYLNEPVLTAEKFLPNPFTLKPGARMYRSGDLVRYLPNGEIEFVGRRDHQVKVRGFRIELGEIEAALGEHPGVSEAVVTAQAVGGSEKRLIAYLVASGTQAPSVSELREFLREKLPEYMVPSAFVRLDALPLSPTGKVDRKALPVPERERAELETAYVAPRTLIEETLAEIWKQVLGLERVGVHDNFFELGGDSILSIQVIARANQRGLHLTPRQLFQFPTIAGLAAVAGTAPATEAEQGIVEGPVPLTPIQRWFFESSDQPMQLHHWNQAALLEVRQPMDRSLLEATITHLLQHHDALRLRFELGPEGWQQLNAGLESLPCSVATGFTWFDLSELPAARQRQIIEAQSAELQASLNLVSGPIVRVAYFDLGAAAPHALLLIIHHLVVDGVSWRILLEDLLQVYQQLSRGEKVALPPKTTSFRQWAQRLVEYAQSEEVRKELSYWLEVTQGSITELPVDFPGGINTEASMRSVRVALQREETRALLEDVPAAYGAEINEALLTALTAAFARWTGSKTLLVDLEGHGREDLFDEVDLSRTVGWFTTIYPARLELGSNDEPGENLKAIKEQLRRVPRRGIGYGLLRYLSDEAAIKQQLAAQPHAEVAFNYLGQFDQMLEQSGGMRLAQESSGPERSPQARRSHLLEISASITNGRLQVEWRYSEKLHRQSTIEALAQWFIASLRALISHCQSPEAGGYTPSDFADVELSQEEIEALMSEVS